MALHCAAKFAPDQTPLRDQYFLEKLVGLGVDDGVPINPVFFSLFNLMGIYPVIYGSLMIPSARGSVVRLLLHHHSVLSERKISITGERCRLLVNDITVYM